MNEVIEIEQVATDELQTIIALLDEYNDIENNPLYRDTKTAGFFLRARHIELEHFFGKFAPRCLRMLLVENKRLEAEIERLQPDSEAS